MPEKSKKDVYKAFLGNCIKVKEMPRMKAVQEMQVKFPGLSVNYLRNLAYQHFPNEPHAGERRVTWKKTVASKPKASKPKAKPAKKPVVKKPVVKKPGQSNQGRDVTTEVIV